MVHIRVSGRSGDIEAAVTQIDRVMHVIKATRTVTPVKGPSFRELQVEPDPPECDHLHGTVVRRGQPETIGAASYLVEYGVCDACRERVVRVRVEEGGVLRSVSVWSGLTAVSSPTICTSI